MWEATGSREGVAVAVKMAADLRQVAPHPSAFLLCSGEGKEAGNCMDGGVGPTSLPLL
jgi:hypothetical protein